ncbi:MAG: hypothetical protein Kow0098_01480 [Ignavibacteriaceae bacterium]
MTIILIKTVGSCEPHKSFLILDNTVDRALRQSVFNTYLLEDILIGRDQPFGLQCSRKQKDDKNIFKNPGFHIEVDRSVKVKIPAGSKLNLTIAEFK